jgi:hypothetical protein
MSGYVMRNSSKPKSMGERYHYTGIAMIDALLSSGALRKSQAGFEIADIDQAFGALSNLAEKVLSFYTEEKKTKKDKEAFVKELRAKGSSQPLIKFKELLQ